MYVLKAESSNGLGVAGRAEVSRTNSVLVCFQSKITKVFGCFCFLFPFEECPSKDDNKCIEGTYTLVFVSPFIFCLFFSCLVFRGQSGNIQGIRPKCSTFYI